MYFLLLFITFHIRRNAEYPDYKIHQEMNSLPTNDINDDMIEYHNSIISARTTTNELMVENKIMSTTAGINGIIINEFKKQGSFEVIGIDSVVNTPNIALIHSDSAGKSVTDGYATNDSTDELIEGANHTQEFSFVLYFICEQALIFSFFRCLYCWWTYNELR